MPHRRIPRLLATSLGLMLFISCTNPQWVCGCSPVEPAALIYGRVTLPDGGPVADAVVQAEVAETDCASAVRRSGELRTRTDGTYRSYIHGGTPGLAEGTCVRVFALDAPGGTAASDTTEIDLRFGMTTPDSAEVDLVLRVR